MAGLASQAESMCWPAAWVPPDTLRQSGRPATEYVAARWPKFLPRCHRIPDTGREAL